MQICRECGQEIPEGSLTCPNCGCALSAEPGKQIGRRRRRERKPRASSATTICPDCGHEVKKGSKYCPGCGLVFFAMPGKPVQEEEIPAEKPTPKKIAKATEVQPKPVKICPECGKQIDKAARSCPSCGLIFYTSPAKPVRPSSVAATTAAAPSVKKRARIRRVIVLGILSAITALGLYHHPRVRILLGKVERTASSKPQVLKTVPSEIPQFDLAIELPDHPSGMIWKDREFLLGNNQEFLGFLKLTRAGDIYEARKAPLPGSSDPEVFGIRPAAWNGKEFVGYSETGLLQLFKKYHFTVHDPSTFRILREYRAPDRIGGLAWDGAGYWAATWTHDLQDSGFLYRLDQDLKVVSKMISPSKRCTGLAWDGFFLWFVDDFSHKVYVLDVKGVNLQIVRSYDILIKSPSGIAFDSQNIWICDYDGKRLYRLSSTLTPFLTRIVEQRGTIPGKVPPAKQLTHSASYRGPSNYPSRNAEVNQFSIEIISDTLYASWNIHVGEYLLSGSSTQKRSKAKSSTFAKYTVTVDGGSLAAPIAKVYDAIPGRNIVEHEPFATSLGPGVYNVCLFIYVQYLDEQRIGRILSKTIPKLEVTNGEDLEKRLDYRSDMLLN